MCTRNLRSAGGEVVGQLTRSDGVINLERIGRIGSFDPSRVNNKGLSLVEIISH
jgi:hypothetical protein